MWCAHVEARGQQLPLLLFTLLRVPLNEMETDLPACPGDPPTCEPSPSQPGIRPAVRYVLLYMDAKDRNLGLHACTGNTFLNKALPPFNCII